MSVRHVEEVASGDSSVSSSKITTEGFSYLFFHTTPYIQYKQNQGIVSAELYPRKDAKLHRYQGISSLYCSFRDIDPFMATLLHCRWKRAASLLGFTPVNLARNEWTPEKEMEAEQLSVIPTLTPTLFSIRLCFKEQWDKVWPGSSSFILW